MIFSDFGMPICVPYAFKAQDLVDLMHPLLTFQSMKEVTTHLMLRQFAKLWQHRELLQLLRSTCLICQEQLQIGQIVAHLEVAHDMPLRRFQYHLKQLARIYVGLQSDEWACDFCGMHLQIDEVDFGFAARAHEHLLTCPLLVQMAVLFGHPIWEHDWPEVVSWPNQATLLEQHRIRNLRLWQLNATISEHPASAYLYLAQCGKWYLDDVMIKDMLNHECLSCGKQFFSAWRFLTHLFDCHNFHQMDTEQCHTLLVFLQNEVPCTLCGAQSHAQTAGKRCVALFNLAVFLCNRHVLHWGRRYACCSDGRDLAAPPQARGIGSVDHGEARDERGIHGQTATNQGPGEGQRPNTRSSAASADQTGSATRRFDQCTVDGDTVFDPLQFGTRINRGRHDSRVCQMATAEGQANNTETPLSLAHDEHFAGPPDQAVDSHSYGSDHQGLPEVSLGGRTGSDALSPMVQDHSPTDPEQGQAHEHGGDASRSSKCASPDAGSRHYSTIPCTPESGRDSNAICPLDLDHIDEGERGALERAQEALIPRFMAAYHDSDQTQLHATQSAGPKTDARTGKHSLRLLLNPSGTCCFANATILGLAWMTLICQGLHPHCWATGYSLMGIVTAWSLVPLDLTNTPAFLELLDGVTWGKADLGRQQDAIDFLCYLLPLLMPSFLHCGWITRPAFHTDVSDLRLADEKGHRFQPLRLVFTDLNLQSSSLQTLVDSWHDSLGLCRAFTEASPCKCITIDRAIPPYNFKCAQALQIGNGNINLPVFTSTGDITHHSYSICAVVLHIGTDPSSGHYRCAVRNGPQWFVYEDGQLPDQLHMLSNVHETQISMLWLCHQSRNPLHPAHLTHPDGARDAVADDGAGT